MYDAVEDRVGEGRVAEVGMCRSSLVLKFFSQR